MEDEDKFGTISFAWGANGGKPYGCEAETLEQENRELKEELTRLRDLVSRFEAELRDSVGEMVRSKDSEDRAGQQCEESRKTEKALRAKNVRLLLKISQHAEMNEARLAELKTENSQLRETCERLKNSDQLTSAKEILIRATLKLKEAIRKTEASSHSRKQSSHSKFSKSDRHSENYKEKDLYLDSCLYGDKNTFDNKELYGDHSRKGEKESYVGLKSYMNKGVYRDKGPFVDSDSYRDIRSYGDPNLNGEKSLVGDSGFIENFDNKLEDLCENLEAVVIESGDRMERLCEEVSETRKQAEGLREAAIFERRSRKKAEETLAKLNDRPSDLGLETKLHRATQRIAQLNAQVDRLKRLGIEGQEAEGLGHWTEASDQLYELDATIDNFNPQRTTAQRLKTSSSPYNSYEFPLASRSIHPYSSSYHLYSSKFTRPSSPSGPHESPNRSTLSGPFNSPILSKSLYRSSPSSPHGSPFPYSSSQLGVPDSPRSLAFKIQTVESRKSELDEQLYLLLQAQKHQSSLEDISIPLTSPSQSHGLNSGHRAFAPLSQNVQVDPLTSIEFPKKDEMFFIRQRLHALKLNYV